MLGMPIPRAGRPLLAVAALLAIPTAAGPARADFVLAGDGRAAPIVAAPAEARDPDLAQAIADLRDWTRLATGIEPEILSETSRPPGPAIFVGQAAVAAGLTVDPAGLGPDGYVIRADRTSLALAGPGPEGTANAIYDLCRQALGVRVHGPGPDGVTVPRLRQVTVPDGFRREQPALAFRQAWYNENVLARARPADREALRLFARRHRAGGVRAIIRHFFAEMIPPDVYFHDHPEYFAEIGGRRVPDGQLCTTNPDLIRAVAGYWIDRFAREPNLKIGSLSPNDGGRFCMCAACRRDAPDLTTRYVHFFNAVAGQVAPRHPDRLLAFYAYADIVEPPYEKGLLLNANLIPVVARYGVCQAHAITDPRCPSNAVFQRQFTGWATIARQIMVREYACLWPVPDLTLAVLAANLRTYQSLGATGLSREYLARGFMSDILMAVDLELMWNPAANPDSIWADLARARFGGAHSELLRVTADLTRVVETVPADRIVTGDARSGIELYQPAELEAASGRVRELAAAAQPPFRARLAREADLLATAFHHVESITAVDRYKRTGATADRQAAAAKLATALTLASRLVGEGQIGANAAGDLERVAAQVAAPGLTAPLSGTFAYEDDLGLGGFSRRDADEIEGFYPGRYGLSLSPGRTGRVAYTFRAALGTRFARVELHDLILRGTATRIEVKVGGNLRNFADGVPLDQREIPHDLTPLVGGSDRFTLIFWAHNSSDRPLLCLDHFGVRGEVR